VTVRLSATERKVAELYSAGLRPREIANALGISINTVYKALSKARRALGALERPSLQLARSYTISVPAPPSKFTPLRLALSLYYNGAPALGGQPAAGAAALPEELNRVLERLERVILQLCQAQRRAGEAPPRREAPSGGDDGDGRLPPLLRKNVWVALLRSKAPTSRGSL
jgi:DNA-binding CsgD family transcriptional regulator